MPDVFENRPVFGLVIATAGQLPPPPSTTNKPIDGQSNSAYIAGSFRDSDVVNGDNLRTLLHSVLDSVWWKGKDITRMPPKTLDPFVHRRADGAGVCQFCMEVYNPAKNAIDCVKAHINLQ